jgi:hypothetical protein
VGVSTTVFHNPAQRARATVALPEGVTVREAQFLLEVLSRVKAKKFGRFVVMVSDGRIVDMEVTEKIDRAMLKFVE